MAHKRRLSNLALDVIETVHEYVSLSDVIKGVAAAYYEAEGKLNNKDIKFVGTVMGQQWLTLFGYKHFEAENTHHLACFYYQNKPNGFSLSDMYVSKFDLEEKAYAMQMDIGLFIPQAIQLCDARSIIKLNHDGFKKKYVENLTNKNYDALEALHLDLFKSEYRKIMLLQGRNPSQLDR